MKLSLWRPGVSSLSRLQHGCKLMARLRKYRLDIVTLWQTGLWSILIESIRCQIVLISARLDRAAKTSIQTQMKLNQSKRTLHLRLSSSPLWPVLDVSMLQIHSLPVQQAITTNKRILLSKARKLAHTLQILWLEAHINKLRVAMQLAFWWIAPRPPHFAITFQKTTWVALHVRGRSLCQTALFHQLVGHEYSNHPKCLTSS